MDENKAYRGNKIIDRSALQIIAALTMVIDHFAIVFLQDSGCYEALRIVGRLSFPIILFLLVEGFMHTRNIGRYMLRIFVCALVSEVPYSLAMTGKVFSIYDHNTLWTLLMCLIVLKTFSFADDRFGGANRNGTASAKKCVAVILATLLSIILYLDYSYIAVLLAVLIYIYHGNKRYETLSIVLINMMCGGSQMFGAAAAVFTAFYNGEKGRIKSGYFFYIFYPAHLLLLWAVHVVL